MGSAVVQNCPYPVTTRSYYSGSAYVVVVYVYIYIVNVCDRAA